MFDLGVLSTRCCVGGNTFIIRSLNSLKKAAPQNHTQERSVSGNWFSNDQYEKFKR